MVHTQQAPQGVKTYDLEDRTYEFAKSVRAFVKKIPKTASNSEDAKQLIRSSGSVAANYIEANESLGKKDFLMKLKICRKEAKESVLWLKLLDLGKDSEFDRERKGLIQEAKEFVYIYNSIIQKAQGK